MNAILAVWATHGNGQRVTTSVLPTHMTGLALINALATLWHNMLSLRATKALDVEEIDMCHGMRACSTSAPLCSALSAASSSDGARSCSSGDAIVRAHASQPSCGDAPPTEARAPGNHSRAHWEIWFGYLY
eukprot:4030847-Pleurochrysis_carterae.AAC.1